MTDGNPPTTFIYGCPPPVMPRPTPDPMVELIRRIQEMQNQPKYGDLFAKMDALAKLLENVRFGLADQAASNYRTLAEKIDAEAKLAAQRSADSIVRHAKVEALLARVNNQVTTINEFIAALRAVKPSASKRPKRKTAKPKRKREWRGQHVRRRSAHAFIKANTSPRSQR